MTFSLHARRAAGSTAPDPPGQAVEPVALGRVGAWVSRLSRSPGEGGLDLTDDPAVRRRAAILITWLTLFGLQITVASQLRGSSTWPMAGGVTLGLGQVLVIVVALTRRNRLSDSGLLLLNLGAVATMIPTLVSTTPVGSLRSAELVLLAPLIIGCVFCRPRWHTAVIAIGCTVGAQLISVKRLAGQPDLVEEILGELVVFCLIALVVRSLRESARAALVQSRRGELTDPLTDLPNRRGFERTGSDLVRRCTRQNEMVAVMVLDLDHFKRVNDEQGHAAGDEVLRRMAELLRSGVRAGNLVARLGGEEFAVLAQVQPGEGRLLAERLRELVQDQLTPITVSIGVIETVPTQATATTSEAEALWHAVARADAGLYASKHAGRNRVTMVT